ncbi:MAG TPA: COX15/CtaA family protein [Sandaracinaceae bacterium]
MLRRYAWGVLAYNLAVILWGAYVRATGSGAGCGAHWPTCNGEVVPRAENVETLVEFTHRVTSGVAFVLVLALMIAALRARPKGHPVRAAAVASFVFMVVEAAVGAGLVLLELVADNQSMARAGWMAAHLVNTFLLVASMTLAALWAAPEATAPRLRGAGAPAWLIGVGLVLTAVVGATGAVTALGDTLFPAESLAHGLVQDFSSTAHFLVRLRVWHPVAAVATGLFVVGVAALTAMLRPEPRVRRAAQALALLFVLQIGGGFLNLVLLAPVWMQLVHLLMADLVWIALVVLGALSLEAPQVPARAGTEGTAVPAAF